MRKISKLTIIGGKFLVVLFLQHLTEKKKSVKIQGALPHHQPTWPDGMLDPIKTEHTLQTQM